MKKTLLAAASILLCCALCACAALPAVTPDPGTTDPGTGVTPTPGTTADSGPLRTAGSYEALRQTLESAYARIVQQYNARGFATGGGVAIMESADAAATAPMSAAEPAGGGSNDYSDTNVQVAGIDEGDRVKTDGRYLYVLSDDGRVRILRADGAQTAELSTVTFDAQGAYDAELYLDGTRMAVVYSRYDEERGLQSTCAVLFDVSDPARPQQLTELAQDGGYRTSRLLDGRLYLISTYYVSAWGWEDGPTPAPRDYVPCTYADGTASMLPPDCIWMSPERGCERYTVLSCIDVQAGEMLDRQAVLMSAGEVYMSAANLYLTAVQNLSEQSEPRREGPYTVVDYRSESATDIARFALGENGPTLSAQGTVPGTLLNQFSLDEHDGFLRVVTTLSRHAYGEYIDERFGFRNWREDESFSGTSNGLYVLDDSLAVVGAIDGLAEDERVYSVRFDGDIGYFVTYRQVDPLFAVDLSDPTDPVILSALKIPGFSQYLHPFGDGLLLGFGQNTTGEFGQYTDGLKLSMFDVSDPADVWECAVLSLDGSWSEGLYNHKAILAMPERGMIAFPMDGDYAVYSYADGAFEELARMRLSDELWLYRARGVRIGEHLYLCAPNGVAVYDLGNWQQTAIV